MRHHSYLTLALWGILIFFSKPSYQASYSPSPPILNPRLLDAFIALQAWKHSIISDPKNFTSNWYGPNVCNYTGVYCAPAPDDPHTTAVAGIDLNHANISGYLPEKLGLLTDLALFHLNSNRFCGTIPDSFRHLRLLYELDISNNQFSGEFPYIVLYLPSLKFLDIRYNEFHGNVPSKLFDINLDALFINNNKFNSSLPDNFANSPVSVVVLANNNIVSDIGLLNQVKVFDVSFNKLVGTLPDSIGEMKMLEQLNVAHNKLSGEIPERACTNHYDTMEEALHAFNHANNNLPMNSYRGGDGMSLVASSGISTTLGNEEPCQQYLSTINMESKKSLMFGKEDPREESPSISNLQLRNMESKKLDYSAFFYGFVAGIILGVLFGCYLM
ncbi:hypothetical protein GH714_003752 [Hevea brasiliensis]|uniref:Cell wall hydroxyproline-rich glycoprotein n=1 Tax=Hevea brasiliensis TaxID=3981 RepID=A0A6A6KQ04_HEVBR|nr:hypothetical protein GH714_003752 [Hevea brasiliensis]